MRMSPSPRSIGNGTRLDLALEELGRAIALEPNLAPLYRTRARWNLERPTCTPAVRRSVIWPISTKPSAWRTQQPRAGERSRRKGSRASRWTSSFSGRSTPAMQPLKIDPKDAEVHRWRVGALLELERERDAIEACDAYLRRAVPSADLLGLRGLAKARRNDFAGAIDDYTLALALEPRRPVVLAGGDGPIWCQEPRNWPCATSRKPSASIPRAETPIAGGDRRCRTGTLRSASPTPRSRSATASGSPDTL